MDKKARGTMMRIIFAEGCCDSRAIRDNISWVTTYYIGRHVPVVSAVCGCGWPLTVSMNR